VQFGLVGHHVTAAHMCVARGGWLLSQVDVANAEVMLDGALILECDFDGLPLFIPSALGPKENSLAVTVRC